MLSPTLMFGTGGSSVAMGSGGSNRIRTALLQVLVNLIDFGMPVKTAVDSPRIHFENGLLSIEGGFELDGLVELTAEFPNHKLWRDRNLFFGGVHVAQRNAADKSFTGAGDPRRGGTSLRVG
jgi:gamma-glutamyltranspeptidase/glutathione hydrolase